MKRGSNLVTAVADLLSQSIQTAQKCDKLSLITPRSIAQEKKKRVESFWNHYLIEQTRV